MFRFNPRGCFIDTGDAATGGGKAAPVDTPVAEAPATETPAADPATVTREDFQKAAPSLRKYQAKPEPEPEAEVKEEGTVEDTPPEVPAESKEPDEAPVKFKLPDGREVTTEELEKGHMMQSDYTKKTQALAEERRKWDEERETGKEQAVKERKLWESLELDPVGTLEKLQAHYAEQGIYEAKDPAILAQEVRARELETENQKLLKEKNDVAYKEAYAALDAQLVELAGQYGPVFDRNTVVQFMIDSKFTDPKKAFFALAHEDITGNMQMMIDDLHGQVTAAKDTAVQDYIKGKQSKGVAPPPVGAGGGGAPPVQLNLPRTFQEARKSAVARLSRASG